jgi:hypothetical protein
MEKIIEELLLELLFFVQVSAEEQKASNAYLYMNETEPFALDSKEGWRNAVCNLLGLLEGDL